MTADRPDFMATAYAESVRREPRKHPDGWDPGLVWHGHSGVVTTPAIVGKPDWSEILREFDLDPAHVELIEPVQFRTWDAAIGNGEVRRMKYYRASVRSRRASDLDIQAQIRELARKRAPKRTENGTDPAHFVVVAADWQLGREGTDDTVTRWGDGIDDVRKRYRDLRKIGRRIGRLGFLSVGDLVEGCKGWYCVAADTPILTGDLRWVPAGTLQAGDPLYAFDEHSRERSPGSLRPGRKPRHFAPSAVTANSVEMMDAVKVTFSSGHTLTCTPEHPILARTLTGRTHSTYEWVEARNLTTQHQTMRVADVWPQEPTFDRGWLGGIFDGEGSFSGQSANHNGPCLLTISQLPGLVHDKIHAILAADAFRIASTIHVASGVGSVRIRGGYPEVLRALGTYRPVRLMPKMGYPEMRPHELVTVVSVEPVGQVPIARMSTSTHTYISNGIPSHNSQQTFTVVLNKREQVRLGRRMVLSALTEWTPDFDGVLAGGIGGNHGENRDETGQSFTDFGDNADVEILEQAGEVAKATPALRHIEWAIPNRDLTLTVNLAGRIVALSHGHQAKGSGASAQAKVRRWWEGQMYGGQPAGDADVLLTGHFHHYSHVRDGQTPTGDPRHHLQAPSLASGARWFTESKGTPEVPGILTFVMDANGLRDVEVL